MVVRRDGRAGTDEDTGDEAGWLSLIRERTMCCSSSC